MNHIERSLAEAARGVLVGERHTRLYILARLEAAHKIETLHFLASGIRVLLADGTPIGEEPSDEYPSVALLARVLLAVDATVGLPDLSPPPPKPKSESARRVIDWKTI